MSYYKCPACGHHDEIFSHGGGKRLAQEVGTEFFGEIPIDTRIRFGGDAGVPIVIASPDSENAQRFMDLASQDRAEDRRQRAVQAQALAAPGGHQVAARGSRGEGSRGEGSRGEGSRGEGSRGEASSGASYPASGSR